MLLCLTPSMWFTMNLFASDSCWWVIHLSLKFILHYSFIKPPFSFLSQITKIPVFFSFPNYQNSHHKPLNHFPTISSSTEMLKVHVTQLSIEKVVDGGFDFIKDLFKIRLDFFRILIWFYFVYAWYMWNFL